MGHGIGKELEPYRLEWRPDLTTGWVLIERLDEHPGELKAYIEKRIANRTPTDYWDGIDGQWRLISQHVIEVMGLGA